MCRTLFRFEIEALLANMADCLEQRGYFIGLSWLTMGHTGRRSATGMTEECEEMRKEALFFCFKLSVSID